MKRLIMIAVMLAIPFIAQANDKIRERIEKLQAEGKEVAEQLQKVDASRQQLAQRLAEIVGALKELQDLENGDNKKKEGK